MNAPYHSKALPEGTILREWRLEQVLGVGGFGIVYRARGVYFDELVAIKEYFPSAVCDRVDGATVTPTDSTSEEIYVLGLQKFVEEAKVLWNLSKPERHPNIVSVRSLFEIHGTAYMVMDFESGVSLSQMLREGRKFDEASLLGLLTPIAEGLDRAHRAGVIHRDIKPANILVDPSGRPVLIDFGSARFDAGQATSTKVTFYTPPYAAIEQYVKTYGQGPWTDIYALGVALYQCVTGVKPPDALERMTGGPGERLSDRDWPGFSRVFTTAVDGAMAIRPAERPQSISQWLRMFVREDPAEAEEATRVSGVIAAIAAPSVAPGAWVDRRAETPAVVAPPPQAPADPEAGRPPEARPDRRLLVVGAAGIVVVLGIALAAIVPRLGHKAAVAAIPTPAATAAAPIMAPQGIEADVQALIDDTKKLGRGSKEVSALVQAQAKIADLTAQVRRLATTPGASMKAPPLIAELNGVAVEAARDEAGVLDRTAQGRAREVQRALSTRSGSLPDGAAHAAAALAEARTRLGASVASVSEAQDAVASIDAARRSLTAYAAFNDAYVAATHFYAPAKQEALTAAVAAAKALSGEVVALAAGPRPGFFASRSRKQAYQALQSNAALARDKEARLAELTQSASTSTDLKQLDAALAQVASLRQELASLYSASLAANQSTGGQKGGLTPTSRSKP